jgi:hypothetical protein
VQTAVGELLKPAMTAMGLDKTFVLRRLIETIDSDVTDYVKVVPTSTARTNADLMSPREMREALPLSKRRLIKKFKSPTISTAASSRARSSLRASRVRSRCSRRFRAG